MGVRIGSVRHTDCYLRRASRFGLNLFGDVFVGHPVQLPYHEHFALRYKTLYSENPRLRGYLYAALKSNSGVLEGYENLQVQRGNVRTVDDPEYNGQVYFENSKGTVSIREWTMARVRVAFQAEIAPIA